jgi:GDP-L-fucose synthase
MKMKNKVWITGNGMVGKALAKNLVNNRDYDLLSTTKSELDQTNQEKTDNWVNNNKPNIIIITSALVGGIQLNSKVPATFLYQNSMINLNIINAARKNDCKKIVFLGASCMYPKNSKQPFEENSIFDGKIEETNEGYGISKLVGLKMIEMINSQYNHSHITIIPAASYGPNDCYDETKNHVIPALIKKFHNAKISNKANVTIWGSGKQKREFIHVDDMASGIVHILEKYKENSPINLGTGQEYTIQDIANIVKDAVNYKGTISFDTSKPDGIKRKILSNKKLNELEWKSKITIKNGIKSTYEDFLKNEA